MNKPMISRLLSGGLLITIAGAAAWVCGDYRRDMHPARERVSSGSRVAQTAHGPVEYAEIGDGSPVLVAHAAGGGFDQGLLFARFLGGDFHYIVPSRFGYLRSSVPDEASAQMQADVYASLLDTLKVDRVAVMGVSAGGPSALQFALRHSDRCRALVMVSAASCNDVPPRTKRGELPFRLMESDFVFWAVESALRSQLLSFFGLSKEVQASLTPEQMRRMGTVIDTMLPMSQRVRGMRFDMDVMYSDLERYPIDRISAPALVVHAKDDHFVRYSHREYTAKRIPGARLFAPERGGHLFAAIDGEAQAEIRAFLTHHASSESLPSK